MPAGFLVVISLGPSENPEAMTKRAKARRKGSAAARPRRSPRASSVKRKAAPPRAPEGLPEVELVGLLDNVKATVIALLASLQAKERGLRKRSQTDVTPGVKTGLSDIRLLRRWADRTLRTIQVLEHGNQDGLRPLLEELGEFSDIVHAHDAEQPALGSERL